MVRNMQGKKANLYMFTFYDSSKFVTVIRTDSKFIKDSLLIFCEILFVMYQMENFCQEKKIKPYPMY